ncbi:MAG TPA: hypothetical protein VGA53_02470 [Candidatus Paceibacterota bacterium]
MRFSVVFAIILLVAAGVGTAMFANAQQEGERRVVPFGQVIEGDYVAAGDTVEISGVVKGDAYVAGAQVLVNGTIEGDLLAVGGTVSIAGQVQQNVRAAGWQVIISGNVGRNVTVGGMNVEITKEADLQGNFVAGAVNTVLNGPVAKSAKIAGRNLTMANKVQGDVEAAVDIIRLASGADLQGNFTYWSNREVSFEEGIQVRGTVTRKAGQGFSGYAEQVSDSVSSFLKPFLGITSFLSSLVLGALLIQLFPNFTRQTVFALREKKWRCLSNGLLALLLIPIIFGVFIITIVGIPLGIMLLFFSSLLLYIARIFVMLWVGMLITEKLGKNVSDMWAFVIGLIVYSVLVQVPVIGWVVPSVAAILGLGAIVSRLKETYFANKHQVLP